MAEELTFRASRSRGLLLFSGSCVFVALGLWLISEGKVLFGWLCAGFFALGIPVSIFMMLSPSSMYLRLDDQGFEMGSFVRKVRIRWTDVQGFEMRRLHSNNMIAIIYAPHYEGQQAGRAVASTLSGMEGAIANSYDAPLDEILKTLKEWQARYCRR